MVSKDPQRSLNSSPAMMRERNGFNLKGFFTVTSDRSFKVRHVVKRLDGFDRIFLRCVAYLVLSAKASNRQSTFLILFFFVHPIESQSLSAMQRFTSSK